MTALRASSTTRTIVEPIHGFWKSIWELAMKAPTYAPIIPTPQGWLSATGLASMGSKIESHFRWEAQNTGTTFWQNLVWWNPDALMNRLDRTLNTHATNTTTRENWEALRESIRELWPVLLQAGAERNRAIERINQRLGLDIDLWSDRDPARIAQEIQRALWESWHRITAPEMLNLWAISTFIATTTWEETPPPGGPTPTTIDITSNTTISPLVSGWRIGADEPTRTANAATIAGEIRTILWASNTVERAEVERRLTGIWITETDDINAIIIALWDKVV